jgi:hypothetical protein
MDGWIDRQLGRFVGLKSHFIITNLFPCRAPQSTYPGAQTVTAAVTNDPTGQEFHHVPQQADKSRTHLWNIAVLTPWSRVLFEKPTVEQPINIVTYIPRAKQRPSKQLYHQSLLGKNSADNGLCCAIAVKITLVTLEKENGHEFSLWRGSILEWRSLEWVFLRK